VTLHIITPEFPPVLGGVADYTRLVARGLAEAGETVHVWCPAVTKYEAADRFEIHEECGRFRARDLAHVGNLLDRFESPRRLLVQWVPHGYGFRSMNLRFCYWLWTRARCGDAVELMVHEPYLAFWEGTWRQNAAAVVHRLMTIVLLQAARRVWVAIPAWESKWRPYTLGRSIPFTWLPVSSSLPSPDEHALNEIRARLATRRPVIGHLGTYGAPVATLLSDALVQLLHKLRTPHILLMGVGSQEFRTSFTRRYPQHAGRITATGSLIDSTLAAHVAACDVLLQPYPDGISSRRTTVMAGLQLGVPIVTTSGHLTEPFWETSGSVQIVRVGEWDVLIEHIERLLQHPDERARLADRGMAFYDRMFDVQRTVAALRTPA
jgi:glycosyltransferase involved in cell wall biosynthesis